jgi:YgiT-type zinc finger domain-containing protein
MRQTRCNFCNSEQFERRFIEYLYSFEGEYLLVPNTPVDVCIGCGMIYYDAAVLKEIERRFFAIRRHDEQPDRIIQIPSKVYA